MVIRECFEITGGNSGLTESVIYQNPPKNEKQSVKVYSGATLETTLLGSVDRNTMLNGKRISVFCAPAIIIVRKGLAGNTKFVEKGIFTINDDAYVITIKEKYLDKIDIEWVQKVIQNYAEGCITSKGTNATFSKEQFLDTEFSYPPMQEQKEIVHICRNIDALKYKINTLAERLERLDHYMIHNDAVCKVNAGKIFELKGGNSGLTEEFIYWNQPKEEKDAVVVFSSSTDMQTNMGGISKNARLKNAPIKVFQGPAIILSRNGQAGKAMFIEKGAFTINDHAYVLTVKQEYKKQVCLEWFSYICEKYTKNCVTSKDSNGTFNKEIFLKEQIELIDYNMQKKIVKKKRSLHTIQEKIKCFMAILDGKGNNVSVDTGSGRY